MAAMASTTSTFTPSNMRVASPENGIRADAPPLRHESPASTMSNSARPRSSQKPVDEAVTTALDKAQSETASKISPELIAQITQNVIRQLQQTGIEPPSSPAPPTLHQPVPQSPATTASGTSPKNAPERVYTPPSPQKHNDDPPVPRSDGRRSPVKNSGAFDTGIKRDPSPFSQGSDTSEVHYTRPKGPSRLCSAKEQTTLERIWGQLFDEEGNATPRLGQLLRGLAVHLIEDYKPKHSLVITPEKMAKYYEDVRLPNEMYPWSTIFDDEQTSISRMYRDLECQHHLVQERPDHRPDIPGLTPIGFEHWVTLLIHANPQAEFERLQKAVLEMPISNPDDKKERFPKEISRRLFPDEGDLRLRYRVEDSMAEHAAIVIPRRTNDESFHSRQESPTRQNKNHSDDTNTTSNNTSTNRVTFADQVTDSTSSSIQPTASMERERKPYSNIPSESAIDDTNPSSVPKPIERERKPYYAQPGGGRQFEEDSSRPAPITVSSEPVRDPARPRAESLMNPGGPKPSRSDSTARSQPMPTPQSRPMDVPRPEIHQHHRAPSNASSSTASTPGRRRRSPSFSRGSTSNSDFRRPEPEIRGYPAGFDPQATSGPRNGGDSFHDESDTRRYFDRQARERAERAKREEESRSYNDASRKSYEPSTASTNRRGPEYAPPDDDYHRSGGGGRGYEYQQPYGGPVYR